VKGVEQVPHLFNGDAVAGKCAVFERSTVTGEHLFPSAVIECNGNVQRRAVCAEVISFPCAPKTAAAGHHPDGFQQIGLSLCIFPDNEVIMRTGRKLYGFQVLEAIGCNAGQSHESPVTCTSK